MLTIIFLSHLLRVCVWLPESKGIISFCFCIRFGYKSFDCYLFCFELILFFNFVPQNFDLFDFYIKFDAYSLNAICFVSNPFLNGILLLILSLYIWFDFIFMSNLVLILLISICFVLDHFYWFFFSISSLNIFLLRIWLRDCFGFVFYRVISISWLGLNLVF